MAEFEALLQSYKLEPSHAADDGYDCITIDINILGYILEGLGEGKELGRVRSATKLYVRGSWESYFPPDPKQWCEDVADVCMLIKKMPNLEELTWISALPFMDTIWAVLPKSLTKLIIDISRPIGVDQHDPRHKKYICQEEMKPLLEFTKLRELRIFGMRDTFQSIVWETVFRNEADDKGMHVLDLQMAEKPLVRQKHWVGARDVQGLTVSNEDGQVYRGIDGKGVLHFEYGTGEYLDDYCMRKARIASKLDEAKPLPLWCVKLDGFVVDQLPFEHELSQVVLLTCGENCIDAGLRAPRTPRAYTWNKWGPSVNNEATHCLIVWPNWAAIFDNDGRRLDPSGNVVDSDRMDLSPPSPEAVPLTTEHLNLKILTEALEGVKRRDSNTSSSSLYGIAGTSADTDSDARLESASTVATRGSVTPKPSVESFAEKDFPVAEIEGFSIPDTINDAPHLKAVEADTVSNVATAGSTSSWTSSSTRISDPACL